MIVDLEKQYQITEITQGIKNVDRVNLFLNGKFWLSLSKQQLLEFKLYKGQNLDEEDKTKLEHESIKGKNKDRVLRYLQIRPRSVEEVKTYLKRKKIPEEESTALIQWLQEQKLLSDVEFTHWYIQTRQQFGFHGPSKIKAELLKKGVSKSIINSVLTESETEETQELAREKLQVLIAKVSPKIKAKNEKEHKAKLIQRLLARGYTYSQIHEALAIARAHQKTR